MSAQLQLPARKHRRERCSFPAKLFLEDIFICDAVVKNISRDGMLLYTTSSSWMPAVFDVYSKELNGSIGVRQIWAKNDHFGVKFERKS